VIGNECSIVLQSGILRSQTVSNRHTRKSKAVISSSAIRTRDAALRSPRRSVGLTVRRGSTVVTAWCAGAAPRQGPARKLSSASRNFAGLWCRTHARC